MLYNLIVMNQKSGMTIANIQLAEDSISEGMGDLASGTLKAIQDVLNELEIGQIKSFETHKKQVLVHKQGAILIALICDIGDNTEVYIPKLQKIANMFNQAVDWETWCGSVDIFNNAITKAKNLITLSEQEIIEILSKELKKLTDSDSEIYGYKLISQSETVGSYIDSNIDDFELTSFLKSNFYAPIDKNIKQIEKIIINFLNEGTKENFFIDYERISIFLKHYIKGLYAVVFLQGMLDPVSDLSQFEQKIIKIGDF